jgi:hypothetical protein
VRSTSRILLGLLACLGLGGAVAAQFTFDGGTVGESLGESVTVVGDLDGDGVPDLASGAPGGTTGGPDTGLVRLHSGADGTPLVGTSSGGRSRRPATRTATAFRTSSSALRRTARTASRRGS